MIREKQSPTEIVIDLTGSAGNAFSLMSQATMWAKELNLDANEIITNMKI